MTEKDFENKIKKFLKEQGIWYLKTWGNAVQRPGIPDIICCIDGLFVGIEVKKEGGKISELQKMEIRKINENLGHAFVVYPEDYEDLIIFITNFEKRSEIFSKLLDKYAI